MSCTVFRCGLESSEKVARHICSKIVKRRRRGGGVVIRSYARETPINATTREGINDLLYGGYEVNDDRLTSPNNKTIPTGDTDQPVYK